MSPRSAPLAQEVLATLESATETPTAYGGVALAWSQVATVWVTLERGALREAAAAPTSPPAVAQAATATARDHPLAAAGQRLTPPGEAPFRVVQVRRGDPLPGAMTLVLDRLA